MTWRLGIVLAPCVCACASVGANIGSPTSGVVCTSDGDDLVVANAHVTLRIDGSRGGIQRLDIGGERVAGPEFLDGVALARNARIQISASKSFYARVDSRVVVDDLIIQRTYELTTGPYVYVQVEIRARSRDAELDRLAWSLTDANVDVATSAPSMFVQSANGELGGLDRERWGQVLSSSIASDRWALTSRPPRLRPGHRVIFALVLSSGEPERSMSPRPLDTNPFYVGLGMRAPSSAGDGGFTFVNWNRFEDLGALLPVRDIVAEDALIRTSMHLVERLRLDGGWPRTFAWSIYPDSDWQAGHVGSLLPLLYTWAFLERVRGHSDARGIYDLLQGTRAILGDSFEDQMDDGVRYIGYSAGMKQRAGGPRGVLNAHSRMLQFASAMREASHLAGDTDAEAQWQELVRFYHPGTHALLGQLYPSQQDGVQLVGWPSYALSIPRVSTVGGSTYYPLASVGGISASYEAAREWEPWFIDFVDEVTRVDVNPLAPPAVPRPSASQALRLARAFPPALAFIYSGECHIRGFELRDVEAPARPRAREVDFDGDGNVDRFYVDRSRPDEVTVSVALGAARPAIWAVFDVDGVAIATGDFDGDGRSDLFAVVPRKKDGVERTWVGLSDGQRFSPVVWGEIAVGTTWSIADANADGRDDVVLDANHALVSTDTRCYPEQPKPMSEGVTLVGPAELVAIDSTGVRERRHDPSAYVRDAPNDRWILSNNPFVSSWVPGFWEEVAPAAVPTDARFDVHVEGTGRWAAYREDDRIIMASDSEAIVEVATATCASVRRYARTLWTPPEPVELPAVHLARKDLAIFELDPAACLPPE